MEPITFDQALEFFNEDYVDIPTLGGQAMVSFSSRNELIYIQNTNGNEYAVNRDHWDTVMQRMLDIPKNERQILGRYNQPQWPEAPNMIFSPYIPAAVRYYHEHKK